MNVIHPEKIVLLGFLSHFPVAGVAWQTLHYLIGFQRLGFDVYYVEAHGCTPGKLMKSDADDGPLRAAEYIEGVMRRIGFEGQWAYHARYPESRYLGMSKGRLGELYRSATLLINLHGSHIPTEELTATNRLVFLETDPVETEIDLHAGRQETIEYLAPHCAFFTYGENLGAVDCRVPRPERFEFRPTRQPVVMEFWEDQSWGEGAAFTTIGNWRQPWRELTFEGEVYRWSKHFEFHKFLDLPRRVRQPFELALSSYEESDRRLLEERGWRVRAALEISRDLEAYRRYIGESRGEFTVAKDQNVRLRSGWFSDRAATYLAAGRPVITQETGFSNVLPTGEGLFAFSTMEEAVGAVESVNANYERHRRGAFAVARECFSHEVVLNRFLRDLGVPLPGRARNVPVLPGGLPDDLVIQPVSRWPTRLPEKTIQTALSLAAPVAVFSGKVTSARASVVIVTHQGLAYTKMCVSSLLMSGWHPEDELIVVDNASTDGTVAFLRESSERNPFLRVVVNDRNLGFAAANSRGLELATGDVLILLNNDTIVPAGWRDALVGWLDDPGIGLVGPVTNRTCNEAQIDAPYRTHGEFVDFAREYTKQHGGVGNDLPMLALFCAGLRREVYAKIGPLDERFEIGMFEDDDYARRMLGAGYRIVCAEDVFVHHFGQASLGELCAGGRYDEVLETNRRRFEEKWGIKWEPHGRRITAEYARLRERVRGSVAPRLPVGATVLVISKGDKRLVDFEGRSGWHFPQADDGRSASIYPEDSTEAIAQLEELRAQGAGFLLIPKPAFWWLEFYSEFRDHLESRYSVLIREKDTCVVFDLGNSVK